jgi:peptidoglycan-N-acetylglucosamine deacetylase
MARGPCVAFALLLLLLAEAWLLPRSISGWILLATFVSGVGFFGWLIAGSTTQFFVPTVHRGPRDSGQVAFTFDDGPDDTFTPRILDVLAESGAKATFFVVGSAVQEHPDLVLRIAREGHLLASHTYTHAHSFHFRGSARMAEDIQSGIDAIERIAGSSPRYFRPPQGLRVPTLRAALARLSTRQVCVTWTVRGFDAFSRSKDAITARVERALGPGAIVALHDGTRFGGYRDRDATVDALRVLLAVCRERGLRCVRLDEMLGG